MLQVKTDMLDIKYTLFEVSLASGSCSSEKGWSITFPYSSVNCESHWETQVEKNVSKLVHMYDIKLMLQGES